MGLWRWTLTLTPNGRTGTVWGDSTRRTKVTCKDRFVLPPLCACDAIPLSSTDRQPRRCWQAQQEVLRPPGVDQGGGGVDDQTSSRKFQVPQWDQCLWRRLAKVFIIWFSNQPSSAKTSSESDHDLWSQKNQNSFSLSLILLCVSEQEIYEYKRITSMLTLMFLVKFRNPVWNIYFWPSGPVAMYVPRMRM